MYDTVEKSCWSVTIRALLVALVVGAFASFIVGFDKQPQVAVATQAVE